METQVFACALDGADRERIIGRVHGEIPVRIEPVRCHPCHIRAPSRHCSNWGSPANRGATGTAIWYAPRISGARLRSCTAARHESLSGIPHLTCFMSREYSGKVAGGCGKRFAVAHHQQNVSAELADRLWWSAKKLPGIIRHTRTYERLGTLRIFKRVPTHHPEAAQIPPIRTVPPDCPIGPGTGHFTNGEPFCCLCCDRNGGRGGQGIASSSHPASATAIGRHQAARRLTWQSLEHSG